MVKYDLGSIRFDFIFSTQVTLLKYAPVIGSERLWHHTKAMIICITRLHDLLFRKYGHNWHCQSNVNVSVSVTTQIPCISPESNVNRRYKKHDDFQGQYICISP